MPRFYLVGREKYRCQSCHLDGRWQMQGPIDDMAFASIAPAGGWAKPRELCLNTRYARTAPLCCM